MAHNSKRTKESIKAALAAFAVIFLLSAVTNNTPFNLMIASFGSTCAIVFAMPKSAASRARNIIFTYTTTSLASFLLYLLFGYATWVMALCVGLSVFLMIYENLVHPPAAGIPIFFYYIKPEPEFLLFPILSGCVVIIIARKLYKNYARRT
jgi:CBS-domain-containing membrane protein